jgi:predicted PurR-regulated permease PerM
MARMPEARRLSQIGFYGTVLLIAYLAWKIVQPFIFQIGWALVLAICLEPVRARVAPRLGHTRTALLLTVLVLVLIVIPVVFIAMTLIGQAGSAVAYVDAQLRSQGGAAGWFHWAWGWVRHRAPFLPDEHAVITRVTSSIGGFAQYVAGQAGGLLASAAGFVFSLFITLAVLFFFLRDADEFAAALRRMLPFGPAQNDRLMKIGSDLVSASVTATLAICVVQGIIGGTTFALLGIPGPVLWGVIMCLLSLLPLLGATLVWAPAAIWLALSGSWVKGLVLAGVGILIMGQVDNVVRPLLLSGKSRMSTLVLVISLLGGVSAFGFIGIVLGPLVAALLTALLEAYQEAPAQQVALEAQAAPSSTDEPSTANDTGDRG